MRFRSVFAGALSLTALQAVLSTDKSAERTGSLFTWFASAVYRTMSPNVPLMPDRRLRNASTTAQPSSATGGSGVATLQFRSVPVPSTPWSPPANPAPVIAPSSSTSST